MADVKVVAPKVVQGMFAGVGDYFMFMLARRIVGPNAAKWAVICRLFASHCSAFVSAYELVHVLLHRQDILKFP